MTRVLIALVCLGIAAPALAAGNAENGRQLAMVADEKDPKTKNGKGCATCHGPDGNKPSAADQPILGGQYYDYLVRALMDYKIGRRNNPIMKGFAGQLSKKDIEDLAAWFASQKSPLHDQR
jgi:cytochrome c553